MSEFDFLSPLDGTLPSDISVAFDTGDLNPLTQQPYILYVKMADENVNRQLAKEVIKKQSKFKHLIRKKKKSEQDIREIDNENIAIYSRCVVTGWQNVVAKNDQGKVVEVPYTPEMGEQFLKQMRSKGLVWTDLQDFAANPDNFVKEYAEALETEQQVEDSVKNSQT